MYLPMMVSQKWESWGVSGVQGIRGVQGGAWHEGCKLKAPQPGNTYQWSCACLEVGPMVYAVAGKAIERWPSKTLHKRRICHP